MSAQVQGQPHRSIMRADELVIGEGVALTVPTAPLAIRIASGLIDLLVVLTTLVGLAFLIDRSPLQLDAAVSYAAGIAVGIAAVIALPTLLETRLRGRTVGKLVTGLRTVRDDGGPIGFRQAFTRALIGVVENVVFLGVPALISAFFSERHQRLGDRAAGTFVVRRRVRLQLPTPAEGHPALQPWVRAADLPALPDHLSLGIRQFLARRDRLAGPSRTRLAGELYAGLLDHVAPAPPPEAPHEAVLQAVLAERRRRDADRLAREDAVRDRLLGPTPR